MQNVLGLLMALWFGLWVLHIVLQSMAGSTFPAWIPALLLVVGYGLGWLAWYVLLPLVGLFLLVRYIKWAWLAGDRNDYTVQ